MQRCTTLARLLGAALLLSLPSCDGAAGGDAGRENDASDERIAVPATSSRVPDGIANGVASPQPTFANGHQDRPTHVLQLVSGAVHDDDGSLWIGDQRHRAVRVYSANGDSVREVGRDGEGPGEFRRVNGVIRGLGDSILMYDEILKRISVLDAQGQFARAISYSALQADGEGRFPQPQLVGQLANGDWVIVARTSGGRRQAGWNPDSFAVIVATPDARLRWTFEQDLAGDIVNSTSPESPRMATLFWPAYAKRVTAAVIGSEIYASDGTADIRVLSADGRVARTLRLGLDAPALTSSLRDEYAEAARRSDTTLAYVIGAHEGPASVPPIRGIRASAERELWIEQLVLPGAQTRRWLILRPDGQLAGVVTGPPEGRPLDVGREAIVLLVHDEDGVAQVHVHRITWDR